MQGCSIGDTLYGFRGRQLKPKSHRREGEMRPLELCRRLGGAAGLMEGQVAATEARLQRCAQCVGVGGQGCCVDSDSALNQHNKPVKRKAKV